MPVDQVKAALSLIQPYLELYVGASYSHTAPLDIEYAIRGDAAYGGEDAAVAATGIEVVPVCPDSEVACGVRHAAVLGGIAVSHKPNRAVGADYGAGELLVVEGG